MLVCPYCNGNKKDYTMGLEIKKYISGMGKEKFAIHCPSCHRIWYPFETKEED